MPISHCDRRRAQSSPAALLAPVAAVAARSPMPTSSRRRTAFDRGDWRQLDALAPALAGHVLARYVDTGSSSRGSTQRRPRRSQSFLARYPDGPLADRLRVDWLKVLGKRGDWNRFALDYPPAAGGGHRACLLRRVQYRYQRDGAASARCREAAMVHRAVDARRMRTAVRRAASRAASCRVADRRERFRLAAAAGNMRLAQAIATDLPGNDRITAREFAGRGSRSVARARQGPVRLEDRGGPRARAVRARARGAQGCRRGARRVARGGARTCRKRTATTAICASRTTRRASSIRRRTDGSAKLRTSR